MTLKSQEYEGACVILGRVHVGRTSTYSTSHAIWLRMRFDFTRTHAFIHTYPARSYLIHGVCNNYSGF